MGNVGATACCNQRRSDYDYDLNDFESTYVVSKLRRPGRAIKVAYTEWEDDSKAETQEDHVRIQSPFEYKYSQYRSGMSLSIAITSAPFLERVLAIVIPNCPSPIMANLFFIFISIY